MPPAPRNPQRIGRPAAMRDMCGSLRGLACPQPVWPRRLSRMRRATIFVRGRVQGVGFRWWARARALELGLVGFARNLDDGRVEICAEGSQEANQRLRGLVEG